MRFGWEHFCVGRGDFVRFGGHSLRMVPALWIALMTATCVTATVVGGAQTRGVTLETLLAEMTDRSAVARWPQPEFTCRQVSSYDRARVAPDKPGWFANHDSSNYLRTETHAGRTEQVMLDADGPGAIVRFWMTSDRRRQGTLRFYLDSTPQSNRASKADDAVRSADAPIKPTLEIPSFDLMASHWTGSPLLHPHTSYDPNGGGGSTLYLPLPYARHCKVTWEEADPKADAPRYYQIDYRTYPPGTAVETFSLRRLQPARKTLDRVNKLLTETSSRLTDLTPGKNSDTVVTLNAASHRNTQGKAAGTQLAAASDSEQPTALLAPGASLSLPLPSGAHAVQALEMQVTTERPEEREQALRSTVIRMEFDGEETVWCPVGDFAGCGVGMQPLQSWYRTVGENGRLLCRWVMPYAKSARITFTNFGKTPVHVQSSARVGGWRWDRRSLYFHAIWRHQTQVPTKPDSDWNFVEIQGQGVLVGDVQTVFNPVPAWYGEGNEKIYVDGEAFPSTLGTGTEDYYNASWAPTPTYQTPFANAPRIDDPKSRGNNTNTRTRNLDTIPFQKSLRFDMEIEHWQDPKIDIGAVTYWYARPGATSNRAPMPEEAARALAQLPQIYRIPGALEFETATILNRTEGLSAGPQEMSPFTNAGAKWSSDTHLVVKAAKPGDFVELRFAAPNGLHRVVLYATRAPDFGILKFTLNGAPATREFDGYASTVLPSGRIDLGVCMVTNGTLRLRAEVTGANPAAVGAHYFFGLDCLTLEPVR
jgi:hypothetical protein